MKQQYAHEWLQFFKATIQEWKHLLKEDKYKNIIVDWIKFLVTKRQVTIYRFVIMPNHLHIIWQAKGNNNLQEIQNSFIKTYFKRVEKTIRKRW